MIDLNICIYWVCCRGEKLYVTKTKSDMNNSKKNCCVWLVGVVTLMVAICLAILIASEYFDILEHFIFIYSIRYLPNTYLSDYSVSV